ncbi:hypothetical protein TgHK011_004794 [Trichoderma gracile]|nr:hypothetical protein TgHK011_004794 [Trichoderma gracile]
MKKKNNRRMQSIREENGESEALMQAKRLALNASSRRHVRHLWRQWRDKDGLDFSSGDDFPSGGRVMNRWAASVG